MESNSIRILIVEDESIVAMEIADRLQVLGYSIAGTADTAEKAIEKASSTNPDLILMDIMLKGDLTGIDAAERIGKNQNTPIIFLTAYADNNTLQRAKVTGPYGYLIKPFEERELHTTIEIALYKYKMEKRLEEREKWLSTTLRSIGEAVIATDKMGCITFMNGVAEKMTGWANDAAKGKFIEDVFFMVNEDTKLPVGNPVMRVIKNGETIGISNHSLIISKHGAKIPVNYNASPIIDDNNDTNGVVLVFRDVSERKNAESMLRESEERFRTLYENSTVGIYRTTPDGSILLANPTLLKMLGFNSAEELKSRGIAEGHVDQNSRKRFMVEIENKEVLFGYEDCWKKKDGSTIHVRESARVVRGKDNKILYYDGTVEDITLRKKMEHELIEAKERAEQSDRIKSEFLATMSHEIRTPINTILNFISLIKSDVQESISDDLKDGFKIIDNGSRRLIRTIDSILNMSQLQAGIFEIHVEELDLYDSILKDLYLEFKQAAELKNIDLSLTNHSNCSLVKADKYSMTQLFVNLIDNAIKYTKTGSIEINILDCTNGYLITEIKDTGIGMTTEFLNKIFQPFTQEESGYSRRFEGSGLGLALVQNYAKLNGAVLEVDSMKGTGSNFKVKIKR